ncbi:MAG: hypothetical protein PUE60_02450 [Eubacteriales bacterium]|nr:hypothetical protein [Eubacteriales bacterium]
MFRLESKILQREFVVHENTLYASQIRNVLSGRDFVPDGNSVEFLFHFTDGSEFSSKGLNVVDSKQEDGKLSFKFEETQGIEVTMTFWAGEDGNTLKKQITFNQNSDKTIDYILLEHIGITNSKAHFSVPTDVEGPELNGVHFSLGQPFYIDTLFFGCEFPATQNIILYGIGQVKYFIGKKINGEYKCPVTVVGGAKSDLLVDVQKSFYNYIESIATPGNLRIQYNSWYDFMKEIDADNIEKSFFEIEKGLTSNGIAPLDAYVVDDGWVDYKSGFWSFNKKFPNQLYDISQITAKLDSHFGLWLGPRGGYGFPDKFAKKMEKLGKGSFNSEAKDVCVADKTYIKNVTDFILKSTKEFDIDYWKFDGFCLAPCKNPNHNHPVGGENDMYFITDMWECWIDVFKKIRELRTKAGKGLWINMTCYVNPSPWWLQYVNSIWVQNSTDIGFADNLEDQAQVDREITFRDARYFNLLNTRAIQMPLNRIYNHEPIYGTYAKVDYTDEEFEKYLYFDACRGQALNELHLSYTMMNKSKWRSLAKVIEWQKSNYDILKNAMFIGGNPEENNVYGYFAWNENGEGIIALRNPTDEKAPLTLTLNKLMGCPEDLKDVQRYNVYNLSNKESYDSFSYGDKIDLTLQPFEVKIFQFGKEDKRFGNGNAITDFTISFDYKGEENIKIASNDDIDISVVKSYVNVKCGRCHLRSNSIVSGGEHKITIVREKNKALKIYVDRHLDASGYDVRAKNTINTDIQSDAPNFKVLNNATPYDEIITLKEILSNVGKRKIFK